MPDIGIAASLNPTLVFFNSVATAQAETALAAAAEGGGSPGGAAGEGAEGEGAEGSGASTSGSAALTIGLPISLVKKIAMVCDVPMCTCIASSEYYALRCQECSVFRKARPPST